MAKKEARISINKLKQVMEHTTTKIPLAGSEDVEIIVKFNLTLSEVLQFVEDVVSSCVDVDSGIYTPEVMWFSIYSSVLTRYANFNLPSNVEKQYELIYNTDALEQVMACINQTQYKEIVEAIQARIAHDRALIENTVTSKINELIVRMNTYIAESKSLFGDVSGNDMSALVRNLADIGKVDEEKLVTALVDAQNKDRNAEVAGNPIAEDHGVIEFRKNKE